MPPKKTVSCSVLSSRRHRRREFRYAHDIYRHVSECANKYSDFQKIESWFNEWLSKYRQQYARLVKLNGKFDSDEYIFIRMYSRFDKKYTNKVKKQLYPIRDIRWDLLLTLTVDPKKFVLLHHEFTKINQGWNKLATYLRKTHGNFIFLKVLEITKVGRPHLHILLSGISFIDHKKLSLLWEKYGLGKVVYIQKIRKRANIKTANYVLKYVLKTMTNMRYASLLFASNKRIYSISRSILPKRQKIDDKPRYRYAGSIDIYFVAELDDSLPDFIRIIADSHLRYANPELFGLEVI